MKIVYKLNNKLHTLDNCNSQNFYKVLKTTINKPIMCSTCKTKESCINIRDKEKSYLFSNGIYDLDKSLCKSCILKNMDKKDIIIIYNKSKKTLKNHTRTDLIKYLCKSKIKCSCGSSNIDWKLFIFNTRWEGHTFNKNSITYNMNYIYCRDCYKNKLYKKYSERGKIARAYLSNKQASENAKNGWNTLKQREDYENIQKKKSISLKESWKNKETVEKHKKALKKLLSDKTYHDNLSNGQLNRSYEDICLNTLYREWGNKYVDKKTDLYYGEYDNNYKIGISVNYKNRKPTYKNKRFHNIQNIRTFDNRYIAAYVEYKIKLKYSVNKLEIVNKKDINKVIRYIKNFKLTKETIKELNNLGYSI